MNRAEILKSVKEIASKKCEKLETDQVAAVYDAVLAFVKERTLADQKLAITDFGTFEAKVVPERRGINPKTQERIMIPEHRKLKFTPSKAFKEMLGK